MQYVYGKFIFDILHSKVYQDFLLCLRSNPNTEKMDYLIKTFIRIIFKGIYIQNTEIVKVDINEPWKMCYEEGLKWQKKNETTTIKARFDEATARRANPKASPVRESLPVRQAGVYCCAPSDGRWVQYYTTFVPYLSRIR